MQNLTRSRAPGFARYWANGLGAMGELDAVPPVMARGAPVTIYGDGKTPCAQPRLPHL